MLKRILFVDDDEDVLDGLELMLRSRRREWQIEIAHSGVEALDKLAESTFDCIVSDMRMPGMDGAALLDRITNQYPGVARFILSGHAEIEPIMRSLPVTHQFLSKPCNAAQLIDTIERTLALQALVDNAEVRAIVGRVDALPSRPEIYTKVTKKLQDADTELADVAELIEQDIAMTAKILQIVNSAFFGLPQKMVSLAQAVAYLGIGMIKNLLLFEGAFRLFKPDQTLAGFSLDTEYQLSLQAAGLVKHMPLNASQMDSTLTAAILHRIGRLVLAQFSSEAFQQVLSSTSEQADFLIEREVLGANHAQIGAYLLGLWGLPFEIVEAVAVYPEPQRQQDQNFHIADALYIASNLLAEHHGQPSVLDQAYLAAKGLEELVDQLREELTVGLD